ncbi:reticulon-3 isoform 3-T3 [Rhynchonycteris naso]
MAELSAATQSPSVSSSSGAEPSAPSGGGSLGSCSALGAKSCSSSCAVHDLIFWRDVKKTGFVFGTTLIVLLSLAAFSVISVISYLILALLSVTISFRVYRSVIQAVQKSEEGHPFKAYLDVDITLSSEAFHNYVNAAMVHVNRALKLIIRLFLVEDLVDSLKLAVFMWLMTYVGAVFNGITLLILAELLVFSVPVVYEKYKDPSKTTWNRKEKGRISIWKPEMLQLPKHHLIAITLLPVL